MGLIGRIRSYISRKRSKPSGTIKTSSGHTSTMHTSSSSSSSSSTTSGGSSGGGGGSSSGGRLPETMTVETLEPEKQEGVIVTDYASGGSSKTKLTPYQVQQIQDRRSAGLSTPEKLTERIETEELPPKKAPGVIIQDRRIGKSRKVYLDSQTGEKLSKKDLKAIKESQKKSRDDIADIRGNGSDRSNSGVDNFNNISSGSRKGILLQDFDIIRLISGRTKKEKKKEKDLNKNISSENNGNRYRTDNFSDVFRLDSEPFELGLGFSSNNKSNSQKKEEKEILINPLTGQPYSTISKAYSKDVFKKYVNEEGYIKGALSYLSAKTGSFVKEKQYQRASKNPNVELYQPEATANIIARAIDTGVYFTPAGPVLFLGEGVEELGTKRGRERISEKSLDLQEKGILGMDVSERTANIIAYGSPVLKIGAGFIGIKSSVKSVNQARKITAVENEIKALEQVEIKSGSLTLIPEGSSSRSLTILKGTQKTSNLNVEYFAELYGAKAGKKIIQTGKGYSIITGKVKYKNFLSRTKEETLVGFSQFEAGAKPIVQIRRGKNVFFINKEVVTPKISNLVLLKSDEGMITALRKLSKDIKGGGKSYVNIVSGRQRRILTDPFEVYVSKTPKTKGAEVVVRNVKKIDTIKILSRDTMDFIDDIKNLGKKKQNPFFSKPESKILKPKSRPEDYSYLLPKEETILKIPAKTKPENTLSLNSVSNAVRDSLKLKPKSNKMSLSGLAVLSAKEREIEEISEIVSTLSKGKSIPKEMDSIREISLTVSEVSRSEVQNRRTKQRGKQKARLKEKQINDVLLKEILGEVPVQKERSKLAQRQRQRLNQIQIQRQIQRNVARSFSEPNLRINLRSSRIIPKKIFPIPNFRKKKGRKQDEFDFDFTDDIAISQDFTAKILGFKPKKIKRKDFYKEFKEQTGIGIRKGVLID